MATNLWGQFKGGMPKNWRLDCTAVSQEERDDILTRYNVECYSLIGYMSDNQLALCLFCWLSALYIMLETWFFAKMRKSIAEIVRLAESMLIKALVPIMRVRLLSPHHRKHSTQMAKVSVYCT